MALTIDWDSKVVYSDASITDLPVHHLELRELEASENGMLHDDICNWQSMNQGGGAYLYQIDYINGYTLEFVGPGPFKISGNLNCTVNPTGVQVERERATAYTTTAIGGSGPTAAEVADEVMARINLAVVNANMVKTNGHEIVGDGTEGNKFRSHLVG